METLIACTLIVAYAVIGVLQIIALFLIPLAAVSFIIFLIDTCRKRN